MTTIHWKKPIKIHLSNLINSAFGKGFTLRGIKVSFPILDEEEVCLVDIEAGNSPLYTDVINKSGIKQKKFFVRSGNSSQDLNIDEATTYIKNRFKY